MSSAASSVLCLDQVWAVIPLIGVYLLLILGKGTLCLGHNEPKSDRAGSLFLLLNAITVSWPRCVVAACLFFCPLLTFRALFYSTGIQRPRYIILIEVEKGLGSNLVCLANVRGNYEAVENTVITDFLVASDDHGHLSSLLMFVIIVYTLALQSYQKHSTFSFACCTEGNLSLLRSLQRTIIQAGLGRTQIRVMIHVNDQLFQVRGATNVQARFRDSAS